VAKTQLANHRQYFASEYYARQDYLKHYSGAHAPPDPAATEGPRGPVIWRSSISGNSGPDGTIPAMAYFLRQSRSRECTGPERMPGFVWRLKDESGKRHQHSLGRRSQPLR